MNLNFGVGIQSEKDQLLHYKHAVDPYITLFKDKIKKAGLKCKFRLRICSCCYEQNNIFYLGDL